jgi:hypothetical protein
MAQPILGHNDSGMPAGEGIGAVTQAVMSRGAVTFVKSAHEPACLRELVPTGAHTYARGSDQYPEDLTPVLVHGRGVRVEDLVASAGGALRVYVPAMDTCSTDSLLVSWPIASAVRQFGTPRGPSTTVNTGTRGAL